MFIVASASFRLLYVMIILTRSQKDHSHGRYRASHGGLALASGNRSVPVGHCSALSAARSGRVVRLGVLQPGRGDGDHRSRHGTTLTLAERICRTRHRFDSPRVSGSHRDLQRAPSAPRPLLVSRLLPTHPYSSFTRQGLPGPSPGHATQDRKGRRHPESRRPASPLRTSRCLIRTSSWSPMLRDRRYAAL
jgi:hypothetical protein